MISRDVANRLVRARQPGRVRGKQVAGRELRENGAAQTAKSRAGGSAVNTPKLEFAFRARLNFPAGPRIRFPVRGGETRGFVSIAGGLVTGPRLEGEVVSGSGGDWPLFRGDGVVAFDARYLIRAKDGTIIQVFNRGFAHAPPEVQAQIERGAKVNAADNYFRVSPVFETEPGPHDWMTRSVFVGYGEKQADHSIFDFFEVR